MTAALPTAEANIVHRRPACKCRVGRRVRFLVPVGVTAEAGPQLAAAAMSMPARSAPLGRGAPGFSIQARMSR